MSNVPRRWLSRLAAVALVAAGVSVAAATPANAFIPDAVSITLAPGQTGSINKVCGTGSASDQVVNGGALVTTPLVRVFESYPPNDYSWTVTATNTASNNQILTIRVDCEVSLQSYWRQARAINVGSGGLGDTTATCPSGRTATAGGWRASNAGFGIITSRANGTTGWQVRARNFNGGTSTLWSYVTCVGNIGLTRHVEPSGAPFSVTIPANGFSNPQRFCASGWTAGAGFNVTDTSGFLLVTAALPTVNWSVMRDEYKWNFKNFDTVSHTIEQNLICYS